MTDAELIEMIGKAIQQRAQEGADSPVYRGDAEYLANAALRVARPIIEAETREKAVEVEPQLEALIYSSMSRDFERRYATHPASMKGDKEREEAVRNITIERDDWVANYDELHADALRMMEALEEIASVEDGEAVYNVRAIARAALRDVEE